ncbi:hypothetical protein GCM10007384_29330 [Aquimarina muelleri]|uniref:HTH araC/xylS-type domain-containing protein n=3 Tax=Aquimarina muelleri TaxID=279356 RepID=A0A918JXX3_9FLAO|nr:hypothetical protein GCM10007384_29330 [Aquimarina muelleri]
MCISFFTLFIVPYYFSNDLQFSKKLFLGVPILLSSIFSIHIGAFFLKRYTKKKNEESKYIRNRILAGFLGLLSVLAMTITAILGDYQAIEQSTMNFGLTAVIATHIHEFIVQRREEAFVLAQLHVKQDNIQIQIAKEIIENILIKFEKFEKEERYLKGKVTLGLLAKKWKTNSKYLSHIVNTHKGKSFTQYVNDLRIAYFKKRIIVDEEFRNYTLKAMAKELGYTSTGTFVNAFYKKERIKLFDYIQKVRSNFRNHP